MTRKIWVASSFVAMLTLPATDLLAVVVEAGGLRTVRLPDLVLLLLGALSFLRLVRTYGLPRLLRSSTYVALVAASLVLLIVVNAQACEECARESFARPTTILRGLALFVAAYLLFITYTTEQRGKGVLLFATVGTIWAIASTFLLLNPQWAPFLLYGETPYLHRPFTSPVQAANFAGVTMLLGAGAALTLNRPTILYLLVPAFTVAIAQAGSRSGMVLLVFSWCAFFGLFVGHRWLVFRGRIPLSAVHIVVSALVAVAVVAVLRTPQMSRSLALIGLTPRQLASGGPDEYRSRVWRNVIESAARGTPSTDVGSVGLSDQATEQSVGLSDQATEQTPPRPASHNVYLEFLQYGGLPSMTGLIGVLVLLSGLTLRYAWEVRGSPRFPFAAALVLAVLFVGAINYGNVTLHLSFVWVLFGFVTACTSSRFEPTNNPRLICHV